MASFSRARLVESETRGLQPHGCWIAVVDANGVIQSLDGLWPAGTLAAGGSYDRFLDEICSDNLERAAAVRAGIRAVASGHIETLTLELPCRLAGRDMRLLLAAAPCRQGVLLTHTETLRADPSDPRPRPTSLPDKPDKAHKMEALGRLTSGVAHDFANLLTLISGYSEMLLDRLRAQGPPLLELEEIRKAATRGASMTAQILDFIRNQAAEPRIVNLNAVVADVEKLLRPIIGEHIRLVTALSLDLGNVKADPEQITRVILNLVFNARDAMPGGGEIVLRTANLDRRPDGVHQLPEGRYVQLTLSDNGEGMDAETLSHLFQPFFTTKQRGKGTGLGLSTVYGIVQQSQGDIWVRSEPGNGTVFTICLPRADESVESPAPLDTPRVAATGAETILVAEDEESVRGLIKHLLTARGYCVLDAVDGRDALRLLAQHPTQIDLLLTDMVMPGMSGRELADKVLAFKPDLKIIYMSGYADDMLLHAGALGPGAAFLRKPLRPDVLASRVREVLDSRVNRAHPAGE
jgi:two-component system, cell cycle sensor histidine kinase and response regulator CckA